MTTLRMILAASALALVAGGAAAQGVHEVRGYEKADGTYVAPHYQTNPDATRNDNYSTRGNVNPYTGQPGTEPRDGEGARPSMPRGASSYGAPITGSSYNQAPYNSSFHNTPDDYTPPQ